jgi:putative inorganic carbon (hco3(-)) transporter
VLRSLWLVMVYVSFMGLGTQAPFVLALGYLWVDTFRPQEVAYIVLNQFPVALLIGAAAFGTYILLDRKSPPRLSMITVVQVILAIWCTITMAWAVAPEFGWEKWDWAFKTLMFSAFIPYVIRSRIQIEAFIQVYVFSLAANLVPFGAKIAISGGGYGRALGLAGSNSGLGEGSTLAAVAVMTIPLVLYLSKHSTLVPKNVLFRLMYVGLAVIALLTTVGTFERTGLIGLLVLAIAVLIKSRHKIFVGIVGIVVAATIAYFASSAWSNRISTIQTYQSDSSAMTRILVWQWTFNYVKSNPLGGGFNMYVINHIDHPPDEANPAGSTEFGRAFHSIYFEMLGEQGWPGLFMFGGLLIGAQVILHKASRRIRNIPELAWLRDLATATQIALAVLTVCGSFIGIAFQPMIHYLLALTVSVAAYVQRVTFAAPTTAERIGVAPQPSWRDRAISSRPGRVA